MTFLTLALFFLSAVSFIRGYPGACFLLFMIACGFMTLRAYGNSIPPHDDNNDRDDFQP